MGAAAAYADKSNVVDVPVGDYVPNPAPVVVDFRQAKAPRGEIAKRLAATASVTAGNLSKDHSGRDVLRALKSGRGDRYTINPYLLEMRDNWNCRILTDPKNIAHIDELARSIATIGVQDDLTVVVQGDSIVLTDGHMRLLATYRAIEVYGAEIKAVPIKTEPQYSKPEDHIFRQLLSGKAKAPLEQAKVFHQLIKFGFSVKDIAERVNGISAMRVAQILDFDSKASESLRELVILDKVSFTQAAETLKASKDDADLAVKTLTAAFGKAEAEGKARATGKHVRAVSGQSSAVSLRKLVREVLGAETTDVDEPSETVTISLEDYNRLAAAVGMA